MNNTDGSTSYKSSEVFKNMEKHDEPLVLKMLNLNTTCSQLKQNYTDRSTLLKNHKDLAGCFEVIACSSAFKNPGNDCVFQFHSQMNAATFKTLNLYHRVTIPDLMKSINQVLFGKIFVCRTIALPFIHENKFQTVIEEPVEESMQSGGGECLIMVAALHLNPKGKTSEEFMSVGTMLLIQDPLLVESSLGGVALCVHPKNFFILSKKLWKKLFSRNYNWPKALESPEQKLVEMQKLGNKAFTEGRFDDAIQHYTIGVKIDPSNTNLRSNLVACFLNLRCYIRALQEAEDVLRMDGNHEKCIYRKVKALWGCLRYKEALEFLRRTIKSNPTLSKNASITSLLSTGIKVLRQNETGKDYDFLKYYSEDLKPKDVGEYQGNIKANFPRGRRPFVTATANILPGQLLVCSKAFATHFSKGDNIDKRKYYELLTLALAKNVYQKISLEPNHARGLFKLPRFIAATRSHSELEVKMGKIISIVKANQVVTLGNSNSLTGAMENSSDLLYRILNSESCVALWLLPSFFETKCIDHNASAEIMGDVKFIRAIKAIPKGERIYVSQFNIVESYFDRKAVEKEVQLACYCRFCNLEALDPKDVHQARFDMMQLMNIRLLQPKDGALGNSENDYTAYLVKCISKLRSFRPKDAELNLHVILPIHYLAKLFFSNKDYTYCITLWKEAYGLAVTAAQGRFIVCFCASLVDSYFLMRCFNEATSWMNELRKQLMIFYGCVDVLEFFEPDTLVKVQSLVDLF